MFCPASWLVLNPQCTIDVILIRIIMNLLPESHKCQCPISLMPSAVEHKIIADKLQSTQSVLVGIGELDSCPMMTSRSVLTRVGIEAWSSVVQGLSDTVQASWQAKQLVRLLNNLACLPG